jgi:ribosome-associated protein
MTEIPAVRIAATCAHLASERKATDISVLNIAEISSFADYFVIASGRNTRQLRAIASAISRMASHHRLHVLGTEGKGSESWILIDLGDVVVHLFSEQTRRLYDLELLWGDAGRVEWGEQPPLDVPEGEQARA